jgi:hypothetical protein
MTVIFLRQYTSLLFRSLTYSEASQLDQQINLTYYWQWESYTKWSTFLKYNLLMQDIQDSPLPHIDWHGEATNMLMRSSHTYMSFSVPAGG